MVNIDINFLIGCTGAAAPEAWRLYNLRTQAVFRWSWGYLMFSIPFILLGGFIAWILEPTSKWAAFYSGLTAPVLLTTAMKDTAEAQKELEDIESKLNKSQLEKTKLVEEKQKLQGTVEALRQKLNPQDLEIFEAELSRAKTEYIRELRAKQSNKMNSEENWAFHERRKNLTVDGGFQTRLSRLKWIAENWIQIVVFMRNSHNSSSHSKRFIYLLLTASILVIAISLSIIHNSKTLPWEAIFDVLRISFFVLLGVIALTTTVLLLKNLHQNRSFKEFLKGL